MSISSPYFSLTAPIASSLSGPWLAGGNSGASSAKQRSKSWTERHPAPDPTPWAQISDPQERLRKALTELCGFYARTEPMRANVLRDAQTMPELAALLAEGWVVLTKRRKYLLATLKLAIDFNTWRSLERGSGLSRKEAVETMVEAVRSSVSRLGTP